MKFNIVLLGAIVLSAGLSFAASGGQPARPSEMGFKVGMSMSTLSGTDVEMSDPLGSGTVPPERRTGFAIGGYLCHQINPNVGLESELWYVMKGAKYSGSGTVYTQGYYVHVDWTSTIKLDYLEVPILLRVAPAPRESASPYFLAGPALGLNLGGKMVEEATASAGGSSASNSATTNLKDLSTLDVGFVLGAGLQIPAGQSKVMLEGRYTWGLTTIDSSTDSADLKNGTLLFSAGIGF